MLLDQENHVVEILAESFEAEVDWGDVFGVGFRALYNGLAVATGVDGQDTAFWDCFADFRCKECE